MTKKLLDNVLKKSGYSKKGKIRKQLSFIEFERREYRKKQGIRRGDSIIQWWYSIPHVWYQEAKIWSRRGPWHFVNRPWQGNEVPTSTYQGWAECCLFNRRAFCAIRWPISRRQWDIHLYRASDSNISEKSKRWLEEKMFKTYRHRQGIRFPFYWRI